MLSTSLEVFLLKMHHILFSVIWQHNLSVQLNIYTRTKLNRMIMKGKLKQWWTIILTKHTIASHLNLLNTTTKKSTKYDIGNPILEKAQQCGVLNQLMMSVCVYASFHFHTFLLYTWVFSSSQYCRYLWFTFSCNHHPVLSNVIYDHYNVIKRKFKQWWSSIPPISTKRTTISHLNWTHWT